MPAKDLYHEQVKTALKKDGWTITHDPLRIDFGNEDVCIDLGAERIIAAEKASEKIAVEVKTFRDPSAIHALEGAVGQYALYRAVLKRTTPERKLFLAVPKEIYNTTLTDVWRNPFRQT